MEESVNHALRVTDTETNATTSELESRSGQLVLKTLHEAVSQSWHEYALCSQTDPEAFFPDKGGSTREAKQICKICPVINECLQYALLHDERFGIWGGMSERDRRRLKKQSG